VASVISTSEFLLNTSVPGIHDYPRGEVQLAVGFSPEELTEMALAAPIYSTTYRFGFVDVNSFKSSSQHSYDKIGLVKLFSPLLKIPYKHLPVIVAYC
jgi:hypothetical protein